MIYRKYIKRFLDIIISLSFIVVFFWLYLIIAFLVYLYDGNPIIYKQERIGYKGKKFKIYKFRTMVRNADKIGALSTAPGDTRITPIGKTLRKLSLDELPQLFNVLEGNMSLIGNRPDVYCEYSELDEAHKKRLDVVPGLTGLASIRGRSLLTPEERLNCEIEYVDNVSFKYDFMILVNTIGVVITQKGVNSSIGDEKKKQK